MTVKIVAKLTTAHDLQPGELFSAAGPSYWDAAMDSGSVGERVFIRTNTPANRAPDANDTIYRITILRSVP